MRRAAALAMLLASVGWVPAREEPVVTARGRMRSEPVLVEARGAPAGWRGTRDRATGVLAQLWGGREEVPGAMADATIAERAARAFVETHLAQLVPGATLADLVTITNRLDGRLRTIAFEQRWRGLRVVGGYVQVVFSRDRVLVATSQALPAVTAVIPQTRARPNLARAAAWIGATVSMRATGERVVMPLVDPAGTLAYHVADVLEATLDGEPWDVYVAPDGAPLVRESRVRRATGSLRYDVGVRRPGGTRMAYPAASASVTVDGEAQVTGSDGTLAWTGTASAAVVTGLAGPFVAVVNQADTLASTTLSIAPNGIATWTNATVEQIDAQLSAFVHVSLGKAHARRIFPSIATWLDATLQVFVNETGTCNASAGDDGLHFYLAGAGCENTARVADVVHHELGHAVHKAAIIPGVGAYQPSLSEGLSDFFAASITEDPGVGRGFTFDDTPVRDIDPPGYELVYPADVAPSSHGTGLIIAGALWDLRKALIAELGAVQGVVVAEQIYAGVAQRAPNIPGAYLAAQIADDDDGDLGNGTPHGCALQAAFGKHGLAEPTFETTRVGVPTLDGLALTVPVTTPSAPPCPVPQVTGVTVTYQVGDGAPQTFALAAAGTTWTGSFPPQPPHTAVTYAVTATLDDQSTVTYPRNAADPLYQLFVGPVDEIWCERFDGDPMWTQRDAAGWEVAAPVAASPSGDPARTFSGELVLGTQVTGDGRYARNASTAVETPMIDAAAWGHVRLQYRRWLTVEDARYDRAEISVNGTSVWSNADTAGGELVHLDREWRFHDLDVTAHAAAPLTLAWSLSTDANRELGGWTIDDVCLVGYDKRATCGDHVVDEGELCDDGNAARNDGCDDLCQIEVEDPGCCSAGASPTSPFFLAFVVGLARRRRRRHCGEAQRAPMCELRPSGVAARARQGT